MTETKLQTEASEVRRDPFVTWLEELRDCDDGDARKRLAAMRRWLAPSLHSQIEAFQAIQPRLSLQESKAREDAAFLIGALFALHDAPGGTGNVGDHFRELVKPDEDPPAKIERRFMSLLAAEGDEFDKALHHAVTLLKSEGVPVEWHQLMRDVQAWKTGNPEAQDRVRQWWSKKFWRRSKPTDANSTDDTTDETQSITNP
jgi:CRISPR system Cascade subunit CasB